MRTKGEWIAWGVLLAAWIGLAVYLLATKERPLCDPHDPTLAVRLGQGQGAKEVGVVYLNWEQARKTQVELKDWVRRYGKCP